MMRDVLDSVTGQPGVRVAAIFGSDGLALCILEADAATGAWLDITSCAVSMESADRDRVDASSVVAFAASWIDDLARTSGGVGWEFEKRFSMVASEGSLVVQLGPGANVLAVLEPEVDPAGISLPMEVAVERLQRLLREMGRSENVQPPAPLAGGQLESRDAAGSAASSPVGGTVPLHELMNDSVREPGAASDISAASAASDATNRSSGDH